MKAIQITSYGGPEALAVVEIEEPVATPGMLVIRTDAAGVNFVDTHMRAGRSLHGTPLPATLGLEGAGVVQSTGAGVTGFVEGDRVAWSSVLGSYAEYIAVPEGKAVMIPDNVEMRMAAAVLLQGVTAHYLAHDTVLLGDGSRCLIHGGAGGVASLLIQMAKMKGAEVFTTVSTRDKARVAIAAGADHVIDYFPGDFGSRIEEVVGTRGIDVVFDAVGAPVFERSLELLRPRGALVSFGHSGGAIPPIAPLELARHGSVWLTRTTSRDFVATPEELRRRANDVFGWVSADQLRPHIGLILPLVDAATAHRETEARRTIGKTLLVP